MDNSSTGIKRVGVKTGLAVCFVEICSQNLFITFGHVFQKLFNSKVMPEVIHASSVKLEVRGSSFRTFGLVFRHCAQ